MDRFPHLNPLHNFGREQGSMPLIYDRDLTQFIYDPTESPSAEEIQNPPPTQVTPLSPKTRRDRTYFQSPKLKKSSQAKQDVNHASLWEISRLYVLMVVNGWLGIAIYYRPPSDIEDR